METGVNGHPGILVVQPVMEEFRIENGNVMLLCHLTGDVTAMDSR